MYVMNRLLMFITQFLRVYVIEIGGKPYLERYQVGGLFGCRIYLHRFLTCDGERHLHDHPWQAVCLVLCGGYMEERLRCFSPNFGMAVEMLPVRWMNRLDERTFHRIASLKPNTWTLMITGPRITFCAFEHNDCKQECCQVEKSWGFIDHVDGTDAGQPEHVFKYVQPFYGQRSDDFLKDAPTGREYRAFQSRLKCDGKVSA